MGASTAGVGAPDAAPGAQAQRVIFIDLARALAVVMMVYGHTAHALLAPEYRVGPVYDAWQFQRGLTSSLFLLLSGFAFSVATSRHWASHLHLSPAAFRRLRRFGFFILLGYALHSPVGNLAGLPTVTEAGWRGFLAVDVLQLIGVTFILIQVLVLIARDRVVFMGIAFALAVLMVALAPAVWARDWTDVMPLGLAAYMSHATGALFPLFPFAALVFGGAACGQLYARWGAGHLAMFANTVLLGAGVLLLGGALLAMRSGFDLYGLYGPGPGAGVPSDFALRTGVSLVILGLVAHASRHIRRLPRVFGAVAQESLVIYFVHLCIVYGSVWNVGAIRYVGPVLGPAQILPFIVVVVGAMILLAWGWNRLKHSRPVAARWTRRVVITAGVVALFV